MSGRLLFPILLVAAVALPYFAVRDANDNPLAAWWNATPNAEGQGEVNASTLGYGATPTRRVAERRLALPADNYLPSNTSSLSPILPPNHPAPPGASTSQGVMGSQGVMATATPLPGGHRTAGHPGHPAVAQAAEATPSPRLIGGPRGQSVADLLRFDISPQWVVDRWPRVSTQLAETQLQGFRVPLVSGTQIQDLTGSLTYYFDQQRQVQRLGFLGHTGDPSALITLMTQRYGLQVEPALGGGMYLSRSGGHPISVLRIRYAPVIRSSNPRASHEVRFELNRPGFDLSREMQAVLRADQKAHQWLPADDPHSTAINSGESDRLVGTGPTVSGSETSPTAASPPGPSKPAVGPPPANSPPPGTPPDTPPEASGPRWPYPGARHDRGF